MAIAKMHRIVELEAPTSRLSNYRWKANHPVRAPMSRQDACSTITLLLCEACILPTSQDQEEDIVADGTSALQHGKSADQLAFQWRWIVGQASCLPFRIVRAPNPALRSRTTPESLVTNSIIAMIFAFMAIFAFQLRWLRVRCLCVFVPSWLRRCGARRFLRLHGSTLR